MLKKSAPESADIHAEREPEPITQHEEECERNSTSILLTALCFHFACGAIFAYGLATNDPSAVILNVLLGIFGAVFFAQCIDLLLGPMSVTSGARGQPPHSLLDLH